jgi:hypothetical protein
VEVQTDTVSIIVNGRERKVASGQLTFDQLVELAYGHPPEGGSIYYTITYHKGDRSGTLTPGQSIAVDNGTRFNVVRTDKS